MSNIIGLFCFKALNQLTLACDLEFLFAAQNNSLKHFMRRNVCFEITRIPQLSNKFTKSLDKDYVIVSRRTLNANIVLFSEKIVSKWYNVRQSLEKCHLAQVY